MKPTKYPVYIISKGRWESRMTARTFEEIGAPYRIVIEEQEYDNYAAVIDPKKILVLPFSNLGLGGIPARNWVWEHSIKEGHERHWILDDNIRYFYRLYKNTKLRVMSTAALRVCEDFTDRFTNMKMSGLNYHYFNPANKKKSAYYLNTRIYSCILLANDIEERWRVLEWEGKPAPFNEDTDLSLQILKKGYTTALLNSFLCGKAATGTVKGGNDEIYKYGQEDYDKRFKFTASLVKAHPDCVQMVERWGRIHHLVDYDRFAHNVPIPKPGLTISPEPNEYGLKLCRVTDNNEVTEVIDHTVPTLDISYIED